MKKNSGRQLLKNPYVWLFIMTSALFGILFVRFILGDYAYFYLDVGADTFDINYPLYCLFADVFQGGGYHDYFMNVGLGMDMSSYVFQYLNPLNLLVVMLPQRLLPWSILLATYLKLLLLSFFGYRLFYCWIRQEWGAVTAALIWTFSGYVMLWGQHYGFCTSMVMFTIFFYLVHLFVDDGEKSRNAILVLWITLMLMTNYYFLYMSGILGAMYVIIYLLFQRSSWKQVVKKIFGLAGMGILGICIGGIFLIPVWNIFQGSTRADAVNLNYLGSMLRPYKAEWRYSVLARLFSNNTLGIADDYTGAGNYYEMAMISTSSLFLLALPYLIKKKETRVKTLALLALSVLFLLFPFSGKLFTMNTGAQRWTFIICMLEALAVGMFVKYVLAEDNRKAVYVSTAAGFVLTAFSWGLLYRAQVKALLELETQYLYLFLIFLLVYTCLLLFSGKSKKWLVPALLAVLCAELVLSNYPTINDRENPTRNQVAMEYYNDGTKEAVGKLRQQDDSVYRVAKTYESASENDSLAQNYNGLSTYMTTNPRELIELKETYGGEGISDNFVTFGNENYLLQSLLGVRYMLANPGDGLSKKNYKLVQETENKEIYENENALPFGYLYDKIWDKEQIMQMEGIDRTLAILQGFYFTDNVGIGTYARKDEEVQQSENRSLMKNTITANDCEVEQTEEGIRIFNMTEDPNIVVEGVGEEAENETVQTITLEIKTEKKTDMALYYRFKEDETFRQDQICIFRVTPKKAVWTYTIPADVTAIRLDVSTPVEQVIVKRMEINSCESANKGLEELKSSSVTVIRYEGNVYQAAVENQKGKPQMLCVPFLYSNGWNAVVDGNAAMVYNINGGLCGIEIAEGSHQVVLEYSMPHKKAGILISIAGVVIYIGWILLFYKKRRKENM